MTIKHVDTTNFMSQKYDHIESNTKMSETHPNYILHAMLMKHTTREEKSQIISLTI